MIWILVFVWFGGYNGDSPGAVNVGKYETKAQCDSAAGVVPASESKDDHGHTYYCFPAPKALNN